MAEPTPGRPGGGNAAGPTSATAATFVVNDKSLKDLHATWQTLIKDVKDFNAELAKLGGGGAKNVDLIRAKLAGLSIGGGSGGGLGGGGGRLPGMPDIPALGHGRTGARPDSIPGSEGQDYPPSERPPLAGGASPWKRGLQATAAVAGAASMFYARRMDDITDADLFFNQQAQNTGGGYRHDEKGQARNALFGRPGGAGYGGGVRGYQNVQDLLGGARAVFSATGGSVGQTNERGMYANGRGMAQLRAAGQLSILNPDMGLTGSAAAVASLYDPTTSARAASMGMGPTVGMRGQLQSPQAIYQQIIARVYGGRRPTARMITEGLQPGANLYLTLTEGMGLTPDAIEQFSRYAIAQANLGPRATAQDVNAAIDAASKGTSGSKLTKHEKDLVNRAGLRDNIRQARNELGGAQARQTIEAGRESEGALMGSFSKLAEFTDKLTDSFKRLNDATGGASGSGLGVLGAAGGGLNSALQSVGGVGGSIFAYQGLRQMLGRGGGRLGGLGGAEGELGMLGRLGGMSLGGVGMGTLAAGAGAAAAGYGAGELADYGLRKAGVKNKWGQAAGGAAAGAATGALVGSVVPGIGTAIGAGVGGIAGGLAGYFAEGGMVPGNHDRDDVDIKATPGELVVPKHIVHRHGGADSLMRQLGFRGRGSDGHYAEGGEVTGDTKGLNAEFLKRLKRWAAYVGQPFHIGSGYRSLAQQKVLYDRWMRKVPGQAKAAKPGSSNHNFGLAVDGPHWRGKNPEKFGLRYPMSFEPWHVEPTNAKEMRGGAASSSVDTSASDGTPPAGASSGGYVSAPNVTATDEKSAFAAWMANSNTAYGTDETPSATDQPPKSGGTDSTQPTATTNTAPSDPTGNAKLGQSKAAARGWTGSEWDSLYKLFQKESGWRTDAANSSSSARGIAQTMMSVHFGKDWQKNKDALDFMRNPSRQIDWGLNYIAQRYTTPSKAWAHSQKFNWYDTGAWQTENETAVVHKDEMVVPAPTARKLRSLLSGQRNQAAMASPSPVMQSSGGGGGVSVSISMPVQLVGKATPDDARHLVELMKDHMEQDEELARMGGG